MHVTSTDQGHRQNLPMPNAVELEHVCKSYDRIIAVDSLSLTIGAGSVHGLLGPNGAGKTSTIRMMIGITVPDSGAIRLFGEPFRRAHRLSAGGARPVSAHEAARSSCVPCRSQGDVDRGCCPQGDFLVRAARTRSLDASETRKAFS